MALLDAITNRFYLADGLRVWSSAASIVAFRNAGGLPHAVVAVSLAVAAAYRPVNKRTNARLAQALAAGIGDAATAAGILAEQPASALDASEAAAKLAGAGRRRAARRQQRQRGRNAQGGRDEQ
jgi:hypothetical protein